MSWQLLFSKQSLKDAKNLKSAKLWKNTEKILSVLRRNPFENPPPYEKLVGDLDGLYSRRINIQHAFFTKSERKNKSFASCECGHITNEFYF